MHLGLHYLPWWGSSTGERRPSIELRGRWQNPNLVMDDDGSLARSFLPDGSVYSGQDPYRTYAREVVPVTFTEGPYSDFKAACRARH
jgi:hypothetical protein